MLKPRPLRTSRHRLFLTCFSLTPFCRSCARRVYSPLADSLSNVSRTISRVPPSVRLMSSISICLMTLLMAVFPASHGDGDARSHGPLDGDGLDVMALDAGRLDGADLVHE